MDRQQDRSLSSGISLPQWIKGKTDLRYDFDDILLSPPFYDDSFYIRYQKSQNSNSSKEGFISEGKHIVPETLNDNNIMSSANQMTKEDSISNLKEAKIDFGKHLLPHQSFMSAVNNKTDDINSKETIASGYTQGTNDGFHDESTFPGKSIVHVANQMISGKLTKIFVLDSHSQQMNSSLENVSKSLPATPLTSPTASPNNSPKANRKIHSNRYFTGPFVPDREKYQGNWILATMFGKSREIITAKIEEESETFVDMESHKPLNRKRSISSQNLTYIVEEKKSADKSIYMLEAKPSELREMNFWSPTSM